MAGQAMARVESQMNTLEGWAQEAINSANAALETLAGIELSTTYPTTYLGMTLEKVSVNKVSLPDDLITSNSDMPLMVGITVPDSPTAPTIDSVTLGTLLAITLPDVPTVTFPSIDLTPPVYSITAPAAWSFTVADIEILDDPFINATKTRLTNNVNNGGTGLSATVEAAIWQRDLERNEQQLSDSTDKLVAAWARMGFTLPDGMLAHSLAELQREYMNKMLDRTREIAIKQAELEQTNLFKSMELSINLFQVMTELMIKYETLVFQSQEATAKFANEYIDLQIKTYMSLVEAYKSEAAAYEMIIRGELAKVEVYKGQLEGQKLIGEVNAQTVQVYIAQINAGKVLMEKYTSEIQAMVAILEGEKAKVEANKAQFDAWAKKQDVLIARYNGQVAMYKAESDVNIAAAQIDVAQAENSIRTAIASMEASQRSFDIAERSMNLKAGLIMEAAKGVAAATSSMAAGAMSALSAHASMGYSETQPLTETAP